MSVEQDISMVLKLREKSAKLYSLHYQNPSLESQKNFFKSLDEVGKYRVEHQKRCPAGVLYECDCFDEVPNVRTILKGSKK